MRREMRLFECVRGSGHAGTARSAESPGSGAFADQTADAARRMFPASASGAAAVHRT